jgi:predicted Fe-Mo cluster-binding NifX family protein
MSEAAIDGQVSESAPKARLRVAVAGREGGRVDKHFGAVEIFLIYDLSAVDHKLVERRKIDQLALPDEERRATIVRILADCRVLLIEKVGEAPKKLLADAGIDAIDKFKGRDIDGALAELAAEYL